MANTVRIKRSTGSSAPNSLANAELVESLLKEAIETQDYLVIMEEKHNVVASTWMRHTIIQLQVIQIMQDQQATVMKLDLVI